ncbi:MAG: hypothetical protein NVS3B18_10590 [Candidatus Dormibacteria bacterium]
MTQRNTSSLAENVVMRRLSLIVAVGFVVGLAPGSTATAAGWTTVAPMSTGRTGLAATAGRDGRIYAIGGTPSSTIGPDNTNIVEAYTPGTNGWVTVAPMPTARYGLAAATGSDGRIYAMGGATLANSGSVTFNAVEAYTPGTKRWATVASMPAEGSGIAAATGSDGRIYAIGAGQGGNTVEAYDTRLSPPTTPGPTSNAATPALSTSPSLASGPLPKSNPLGLAGASRSGGIAAAPAIVVLVIVGAGSVLFAAYSARRKRTRAVASIPAEHRPRSD